jgi:hypothetical protein
MMEKEFIPYEQALALKELGFEEICLGFYDPNHEYLYIVGNALNYNFISTLPESLKVKNPRLRDISAPLYQQAFRWFREKYNLYGTIRYGYNEFDESIYLFPSVNGVIAGDDSFKIQEESELECLNKLIEILKDKKSL